MSLSSFLSIFQSYLYLFSRRNSTEPIKTNYSHEGEIENIPVPYFTHYVSLLPHVEITRKWALHAWMSHSTVCNTTVSTKKTRRTLMK